MFKKAIIASAVLAASTGLAFANGGTYQPAPSCVHSCYVGVAVSRDFFNVNGNGSVDNVDLGNDGWNGELNAGIGWVMQDHYYLGGEIFGDVSSAKIKGTGTVSIPGVTETGSFTLRDKYSYGIDFVPGVKISDSTMLYGKVGYIRTKFKASGTENVSSIFGSASRSGSISKSLNGLQLGLGLETMVTNNVSAKLEYDWNHYSKFNHTNFRPTVDQVKFGVAYHFMEA